MANAVSAGLSEKVLDRIDDEGVRPASDLIRIPSFTTEETSCADWPADLFLCTRVLALSALEATL